MTPAHRQHARRRAGLTLLELLLATAGTALIGAATASMLFAVSRGTDSDTDMRSLVSRGNSVGNRLDTALRSSAQVLASNADTLVLWMADTDGDDVPALSELRRLDHDTANDRLQSSTIAGSATDVIYSLSDDFLAVTDTAIGNGSLDTTVWAQNLTAATWTFNHADPTAASLVGYQLTLTQGPRDHALVGTCRLRNMP